MTFTDTHCHIHESSYRKAQEAIHRASDAGVKRLICVGTDEGTSKEAYKFAKKRDNIWSTVGLHPHDAKNGATVVAELEDILKKDCLSQVQTVVGVGECGLDYFYNNSPRDVQIAIFEAQLQLALDYNLPVSFHVREAFDDFWPIFDSFKGLKGVLHSFTDSMSNMEQGLTRGLYIGVNGISTFTKDAKQVEMFSSVPVSRLLFETDAPFLTPHPHRGKVNEPAFITHVAQRMLELYSSSEANLQSINLEELSRATERNANTLFQINN